MILEKNGETFAEAGKTFRIGGMVWANDNSDYCDLFGFVKEIRSGSDKETENTGPDIYCDFLLPEQEYMVGELEKRFSELYRMPKHIDELPLGGVVMAPEMLEPVAEALPERAGNLFALEYTYDGESDSNYGMLAISEDKSVLMRAMFDDLDEFMEDDDCKAVLLCVYIEEGRERYVFEPSNEEKSSFILEYRIFEVPAYSITKGGAAV